MSKKFNFDYCVNRVQILKEMARPVNLFGMGQTELNSAYDSLRKYINSKTMESSGITTEKALQYMRQYLEDNVNLTEDEIKSMKSRTGGFQAGAIKTILAKVAKDGRLNKQDFISHITDEEEIENFLDVRKTIKGSRAIGRDKEVQELTEISREELSELSAKMVPIAREISRRMRIKDNVGVDTNVGDNEPEYDNNTLFAEYIVDNINKFLMRQRQAEIEGRLSENDNERSLFADRNDSPEIKIFKAVQPRDVQAIKGMYEKRIQDGIGETPEGFHTFITKMENKGLSPLHIQFLKQIFKESEMDYDNFMQDKRDPNAQIPDLPGFDGEVVKSVIQDDETLHEFILWVTAKAKLEMGSIAKDMETLKISDMGRFAPKEEIKKESYDIVDDILNEQILRESFQKENPKFQERNFKKMRNTYEWLEINKELFG